MKKVQPWIAVVLGAAVALLVVGGYALGQSGSVSLELDSVRQARATAHAGDAPQAVAFAQPAQAVPATTPPDSDAAALHGWIGHFLVGFATLFWIGISAYMICRLARKPLEEIRQGLNCSCSELRPVTRIDERLLDALGSQGAHFVAEAPAGEHGALDPERTERIAAEMRESISKIVSLQMQTADVETIAKTVREVAEQMHLLALNATLDAAEGGEEARDFAAAAGKVAVEAEASAREIEAVVARNKPGGERSVRAA